MKVLMWPIALMRADTDMNGKIYPRKFKVETKEKALVTYLISHIQYWDEERLAGNRMKLFRCEVSMDGVLRVIELKYELSTCRWFLYKM